MLRISPTLELPLDAVTQAIGILARRGAGKTYTASVLVEEVIRAHLPVVVLDPTGAWWGLRSSTDGEKPGLPVVIFGGEHGDVPLEATAGKVIADVVIEHPGAYVIDLSGLESKAAEHRFAADFLERLYRAKATHRDPLLVVVDEADGFAPQRPGPEQTRTLGALEAIVRRGRIRGLGVVLVTQRAAVLSKNVLTQIEVLVAMQTTGPQDRAAIDDWIKGNGTPEERAEVLGSLASLEQGEAWVWSPSWLRQLVRIRIRTRRTFDSSKTPEAGQQRVEPRAFAKVNLEQLGERIRATAETAKANDPAELRRRIAELERSASTRQAPEPIIERVEVPVLNGQIDKLEAIVGDLRTIGQGMVVAGTGLAGVADSIIAAIGRVTATPQRGQAERAPRGVPAQPASDRGEPAVATLAPAAPRRAPAPVDGPASLGKPERAILTALAAFPIALTREQLAFLAGYHPRSKGFVNALGAMRSSGLIEAGFPATMTEAGRALVPDQRVRPEELVILWVSRLGRAERAILERLVNQYPAAADRDELAREAGFEHVRSKGFVNALGRLRSLGLVQGLAAHPDFAAPGRAVRPGWQSTLTGRSEPRALTVAVGPVSALRVLQPTQRDRWHEPPTGAPGVARPAPRGGHDHPGPRGADRHQPGRAVPDRARHEHRAPGPGDPAAAGVRPGRDDHPRRSLRVAMSQHRSSRRAAYGRRGHELATRPGAFIAAPARRSSTEREFDQADFLEPTVSPVRTCLGCGCTDDRACPGGCWWTYLDPADGGPLCSRCAPDAG